MQQLVSAFILSRLDYCNSILISCPWSTIAPLQRVQNAAAPACPVGDGQLCDHVKSALHELHWLPIPLRIEFKVALLMFLAHTNECPAYISEAVTSVICGPSHRRLRSSDGTNYTTPRTRTKFGHRTFSLLSCRTFLPSGTLSLNTHSFKRRLKTYYFHVIFILLYLRLFSTL